MRGLGVGWILGSAGRQAACDTVEAVHGLNAVTATAGSSLAATAPLDLTDFKRDLSELTDRLGQAQDCL